MELERKFIGNPDFVTIQTEDSEVTGKFEDGIFSLDDVVVSYKKGDNGYLTGEQITIKALDTPVKYVMLRWNEKAPSDVRILCDEWERGYGDFEWRGICSARSLPWYFLQAEKRYFTKVNDVDTPIECDYHVAGFGVKVRPDAMCFWMRDNQGITLCMDVRCGGSGVILNGRTIKAAEIIYACGNAKDTFSACVKFCKMMCDDGIFPPHPVYGSNNWYYAYGKSSEIEILQDTDYIIEVTKKAANPPYMVIDDGWQEFRTDEYIGGPWVCGNEKFPDIQGLASKIKAKGARPGIWMRLLLDNSAEIPDEWRISYNGCLDPTHPDVLNHIKDDVNRICSWGYELIKHDFSTFDLFGRWGFEMNPTVTVDGWHFHDRSKTSAEAVKMFYEVVLEASRVNNAVILGCNTIGHLGAGLMHMNRTGDDTSGFNWERTRRMGINTLAFRLAQNGIFYDVDADCVGITGEIPWEFNRQWADVIAESGTSLFISAKPGVLNETEKEELRKIMVTASGQTNRKVPKDWMDTDCPSVWSDDNEVKEYKWYAESGERIECRQGLYHINLPL